MSEVPPSIELAAFSEYVGDDFLIHFGDEVRSTKLLEAEGRTSGDADPSQPVRSFALLFVDPASTVNSYFPQGMYRVEHHELGSHDLFLVPVGPEKPLSPGDPSTGICYEAVFSTLKP